LLKVRVSLNFERELVLSLRRFLLRKDISLRMPYDSLRGDFSLYNLEQSYLLAKKDKGRSKYYTAYLLHVSFRPSILAMHISEWFISDAKIVEKYFYNVSARGTSLYSICEV
jgi:hypothetical protein